LVPVQFEEDDRATTVGRRGSLGGELGTWVEVRPPLPACNHHQQPDTTSTTGTKHFQSLLPPRQFHTG
jgi:hypothetical protein